MYPDVARRFVVNLLSVTASLNGSSIALKMDQDIPLSVDSIVPYLYLPSPLCREFESALGLSYNSTNGLYMLSDTQHAILASSNASITFQLGTDTGSSFTVTFPYAAFDLLASYPLQAKPAHYFPIKQAQNETQYTLGRVFLQET
jgi:hypothetical protein